MEAGEYATGVRQTGRMWRVVGKHPRGKEGKGRGTGAFRRDSEGEGYLSRTVTKQGRFRAMRSIDS